MKPGARLLSAKPPHTQRGFLLMTAVVLIVIAALLLSAMVYLSATSNESGAANAQSSQALFSAESGIEYATRRFSIPTSCNALGPDTQSFDGGQFTIAGPSAGFDPAMSFDNVTPLSSGRCRVRSTGTKNNTSRTVEAIVEPGGAITLRVASAPASSGGSPGTNSLTINRPAGLATGDVMLAQLTVRANICSAGGNTPPAGWTTIGCVNSGTTISQAAYYKVAGAAEPATYTWNFNNGRSTLGLAAFRGVDNTTPINASGGQANASSINIVAPSITTTVPHTLLVGLFGSAQSDAITPSAAPPPGMTEMYDVASGAGPNGTTTEAAYATQDAVGATGTRTATSTGGSAAVNIGQLVALRPATGGAGGGTRIVGWREVFR